MSRTATYTDLEAAQVKAKRLAKKNRKEYFIERTKSGKYVIMGRQPLACFGEWYHVYSDGLIIQRGSI